MIPSVRGVPAPSMGIFEWFLVGAAVFAAVDAVVCFRWVRRAQAARDAGEEPPPRPLLLRIGAGDD